MFEDIIKLRNAIGYMMEKQNWWHSNFFSTSSNDFLGYVFPKSLNLKRNFYLDIFRNNIDQEVGANYYHLFRLPIQFEEKLFKINDSNNFELKTIEDDALAIIKNMSENLEINNRQGPINIGSVEELDKDLIKVFAAHYLSAFQNKYKVHPYLN